METENQTNCIGARPLTPTRCIGLFAAMENKNASRLTEMQA
jgi:hypothetical protein